jgi:hypothetical protein
MRRIIVLLLAMALIATLAPAAVAQESEAPAGPASVVLLTPATAPVQAGNAAWVLLNWAATGGDAWNFRLNATATSGASVAYPTNTVDHSSLMSNDILSNGEVDFTALHIDVPAAAVGPVDLNLSLSYDTAAGPQSIDVQLDVPIVTFDGDALASTSDDLGAIDRNSTKWVDFWFTGLAPVVGDIHLTVTDPGAFGVVYPQDGTFSSLYYQSQLASGESDVARIRLDATGVEPGTYKIGVRTDYVVGGQMQSIDHSAVVVVGADINRDAGRLVVGDNPNRKDPFVLDAASIRGGKIYVFLDTSSEDIATVEFSMDGRFIKTEYAAPYDLLGTQSNGKAPALDTRGMSGEHTITAEVRFSDGSTETVSATFTVTGR